jgi:hypothetical protein
MQTVHMRTVNSGGRSLVRNFALKGLASFLLMVLIFPLAAAAQAGTGLAHDLSGVWKPGPSDQTPAPPMTPAAQLRFDSNTRELKSGRPITIDPAYSCHPPGVPRIYTYGVNPVEIVQTPQRIFIFYESAHMWRQVWMDGRSMPTDSDPLWMGYSIGHWDGNDLVVESANFNDKTWLDGAGHPHSEALKVTERIQRIDHDHLRISLLIEDPKFYTAGWKTQRTYDLKPTWAVGEAFCIAEDEAQWFEKNLPESGGKPATGK